MLPRDSTYSHVNEPIYQAFAERPCPGGLTYSGHPLACAAAVATIRTMEDDRIVEHADEFGRTVLGPGLHELAERHELIGGVLPLVNANRIHVVPPLITTADEVREGLSIKDHALAEH